MTIQQLCRENQIYKLKVIQLTKERQMLECDYNARLKADMVAILTEIQLELEEVYKNANNPYHYGPLDVHRIIEERIDALKGEEK